MIDYQAVTTPTECELVIAVADLARFSRTARLISDRATFELLDEFYELTGTIVEKAGGKVVKFLGDAALIVFAGDAPDRALAGLRALKDAADDRLSAHNPDLKLQIRVDLGRVVCGPLGTVADKRFDVVGNMVNELFLMERDDFVISDRLEQRFGTQPGPGDRDQGN